MADSYEDGLQEGADCVVLHVEGCGPNDADGEANGVIRDPGGAGVSATSGPQNSDGSSSSSDGGGALSTYELVFLLLILLNMNATWRPKRRRIAAS